MLEPDDPFRGPISPIKVTGETPYCLDLGHYTLLLHELMREGLAPSIEDRNPYERAYFEGVSKFVVANSRVRQEIVSALIYSDDLVIPNVDLHPGELFHQEVVRLASTGSFYKMRSRDCLEFLESLEDLVLSHPISKANEYRSSDYRRAIRVLLDFEAETDDADQRLANQVLGLLIQNDRSTLTYSRESGVPLLSLRYSHTQTRQPRQEHSLALVEFYFQNAVYSPRASSITEALDLRMNSKIEEWRLRLAEWTRALSSGQLSTREILGEVESANGIIRRAGFAVGMMPAWRIYAAVPITYLLSLVDGGTLGALAAGAFLLADTGELIGRVIWSGQIEGRQALPNWYLLDELSPPQPPLLPNT